jgi:RimJ/RimL family protein N-acetyltransferase
MPFAGHSDGRICSRQRGAASILGVVTDTSSAWAVAGLRLRIGELILRPVIEADLDTLGGLLPADVELDPSIAQPFGLAPPQARAVAIRQEYWRRLAGWTPTAWILEFVVLRGDEIIGTQTLEAHDFAVLRTVETSSWLGTEARGQGVGKAMRTAALALAFDGLGAEVAETQAWADNAASIGVSRALGYEPNGTTRRVRGGRPGADQGVGVRDDMPRLRIDLNGWRSRTRPTVEMSGLDDCRAWFGGP